MRSAIFILFAAVAWADEEKLGCRVFSTSTVEVGCSRTPTEREVGDATSITACGSREKPCFVKKIFKTGGLEQDCNDCIVMKYGNPAKELHGQILSIEQGSADEDKYEINFEAYKELTGLSPATCEAAVEGTITVEDEDCHIHANCRKLADELGNGECAQIVEAGVTGCGDADKPCSIAMQDASHGKNQCDKCYKVQLGTGTERHVRVVTKQNGPANDASWQMQLPGFLWNAITDQAVDCSGATQQVLEFEDEMCRGTDPPTVAPPTNATTTGSSAVGRGAWATLAGAAAVAVALGV